MSEQEISTDTEKTECVANWPVPKTVKQVRQFVGVASYYKRFIHNFAQIARPLHKLTEKETSFLWSPECQSTFEVLKEKLTSSPILAYPVQGLGYSMDTGASNESLGSVLSQVQDGQKRVISYYSRCFSKAERNYCVTRRELLAIVASVKHFHFYLYGSKCTVRTDHGSLTWLFRISNPEGQIAMWIETLSIYYLTLTFRHGRIHSNADGMSRIPCQSCTFCDKKIVTETTESKVGNISMEQVRKMTLRSDVNQEDQVEDNPQGVSWIEAKSPQTLREGQLNDPIIKHVIQWKRNSEARPPWDQISHLGNHCKSCWSQWDRLVLIEEVLYREWYDSKTNIKSLQLVLPQVWQSEVLQMLHEDPCAGHLGIHRTIARVRNRFYWMGFKQDIEDSINMCCQCQARKMSAIPGRAPLKSYIVGSPMERIQ